MSDILQRIKQISDNEHITISAIERKIGASKGVLSRAIANNTDIQAKWIILLVENYPKYSTRWLLLGVGDMFHKGDSTDQYTKNDTITMELLSDNRRLNKEVLELTRENERLKQMVEGAGCVDTETSKGDNQNHNKRAG